MTKEVRKDNTSDKSNLFKGKDYNLAYSATDIKVKPKLQKKGSKSKSANIDNESDTPHEQDSENYHYSETPI